MVRRFGGDDDLLSQGWWSLWVAKGPSDGLTPSNHWWRRYLRHRWLDYLRREKVRRERESVPGRERESVGDVDVGQFELDEELDRVLRGRLAGCTWKELGYVGRSVFNVQQRLAVACGFYDDHH